MEKLIDIDFHLLHLHLLHEKSKLNKLIRHHITESESDERDIEGDNSVTCNRYKEHHDYSCITNKKGIHNITSGEHLQTKRVDAKVGKHVHFPEICMKHPRVQQLSTCSKLPQIGNPKETWLL